MHENSSNAPIPDLQRSAAKYLSATTDDWPNVKSPDDGAPVLSQLDRAIIEAGEEMNFDWPEFLPVERITRGIAEMALASLLLAGLVALGHFFFLSLSS